MYQITKEFHFEMAHVLTGYVGPCGNLHGHSYRCLMTFEGPLGCAGEESMVIDFNEVKSRCGDIIDELDHSFAYNINSTDLFELAIADACKNYNKKVSAFATRTTAEEMSKAIYKEVNERISDLPVKCTKVQLYETVTGNAIFMED